MEGTEEPETRVLFCALLISHNNSIAQLKGVASFFLVDHFCNLFLTAQILAISTRPPKEQLVLNCFVFCIWTHPVQPLPLHRLESLMLWKTVPFSWWQPSCLHAGDFSCEHGGLCWINWSWHWVELRDGMPGLQRFKSRSHMVSFFSFTQADGLCGWCFPVLYSYHTWESLW